VETPARLVRLRRVDDTLVVVLAGHWRFAVGGPSEAADLWRALDDPTIRRVAFDSSELASWDSTLIAFVRRVLAAVRERDAGRRPAIDTGGLPAGANKLLALVDEAPIATPPAAPPRPRWLARLGERTGARARSQMAAVAFVGDTAISLARLATGRASFRLRELFLHIQQCGPRALPIVGLVSFLAGVILAFVSAAQLRLVGTVIYVADLVGIAMVREMGAVMSAIVLAGRTGAAFAAELGTMRMTQEVDALTTLGISASEFLVLPRLIALTIMLPLLCLYADLMGVLGGAFVGVLILGIAPELYVQETLQAVTTSHLIGGVVKASVYGALVAGAGCFEGLRAGRTAGAVGQAATAAVVDGIVLVILAWSGFSILFYAVGWT
jgi:phospholipid/cholesterol/gamma-HCH transport system permease protein